MLKLSEDAMSGLPQIALWASPIPHIDKGLVEFRHGVIVNRLFPRQYIRMNGEPPRQIATRDSAFGQAFEYFAGRCGVSQ